MSVEEAAREEFMQVMDFLDRQNVRLEKRWALDSDRVHRGGHTERALADAYAQAQKARD